MRTIKLFSFLVLLTSSLMFIQCTSDPIPGPAGGDGADGADGVDGVSTGAGTSTTELLAKKVFLGPQIDGVIDASWADAQILTATTEVPDPLGDDGTQVFEGYVDQTQDATLRALYDDEYIYLLAQWKDDNNDANRDTWYFDPADKLWKQESNKPVFENGVKVREAFYEDKFAMLFNVNNSVDDWSNNSCFATCHTGLTQAEGYSRHFTAAAGQTIDMWHWKNARTNFYGQFDDQRQDETQPNGRHSDSNNGQAPYTNNKQTLNNGTADVSVPLYFIPGREYYYWITIDEINSDTAKLITAVDANGVLTYNGGTIDPNAEVKFQRDGATTGAYGMPSIWVQPSNGSRGDITAVGVFTGSGWVLEFKRKLNTGDTSGADVDFSSLADFPFGFATFNNAAIAHGIKPFMTLKFEQ
jgi:Ethylbenzene dehydrogenase